MLLILISWIYVLSLSFLYGHAFISFISDTLKDRPKVHFSVYVISGFALIAAISTFFSLFIKLGAVANGILLLLALLYVLLKAKTLNACRKAYLAQLAHTPRMVYLFFLVVVGMALILSAAPDAKFDDGLYYRQSIKWMENYPAVAGLGNLHLKFSFNSSWHILSALFSFSFLGLQLNDLNGLLFIVVALFALDGLRAIIRGKYHFSDVFRVLTFAPLHLLYSYVISPSPDLVIPYLTWIIFVLFLQKLEREDLEKFDTQSLLILTLSVFAVVSKLSAAPIALISLYLLMLQLRKHNYKALLPVGALLLFLVTPWMARNVVLSGYLVYPFYHLDLFDVDWKIPAELVKLEVLETKSFAKIRRMLFTEVDRLSIAEWLPYWFWQLRTSERLVVLLVLGISLVLPFALAFKLLTKKLNENKRAVIVLFLTLYAGIFFWFFTAPHFRYGMGFTVGLYLLCISYLFYKFSRRYYKLFIAGLPVLLLVFLLKPAWNTLQWHAPKNMMSLLQPARVNHNTARLVEHNGIAVYVPDSTAQCWDAPLPCAPFVVEGLQLRTNKIEDGFRVIDADPTIYSRKRLESMKSNGHIYNIIHHN